MNLDNLLLRLQALRERVGEMQAERSEALPQAYLPELTTTTIAEVSTALSELQSDLRGVSDRWQLATSTLNSIIYDWDIARRTVDRTQGLFDVLGYRPEEVLPTLDWWTERIHPDDKERVRNEVRDALATQTEFATEYQILNKHESYRYVWDRGRIVRNTSGKAVRVVGSTLDITERKLAEAAQHKSQELLHTVVTNAPVVLYILDKEGVFTLCEGKGLESLGKKPDQLVEHSIFELYRNNPEIGENIRRALAGTQVTWISHIGEVAFNNLVTPLRDETGQVCCVVGVATEITKLTRAEKARRESERRFRAIFNNELELWVQERTAALSETNCKLEAEIADRKIAQEKLRRSKERFRRAIVHAPFPIMIHAEDGEVIQINQAWTDQTGYTHSDIPTTAEWTQRAYGERRELIQVGIDRLYDLDTRIEEGEFTITTRHGQTKIWDFSSAPLGRLGNGKRLVISMAKDITARKIVENALWQSEERYRLLVMASATYVWTTDAQGEALIAPLPWQTLTGMSEEQWKGWGWLQALHPDDRERIAHLWRQAVETKCLYEAEFRQRTVDGSYRYFLARGVPVFEADGSVREWVGANTDITDRKQAEEKLRQSEARFRATLEGSLDAFFIFQSVRDEEGQIVDFAFVELNSNGEKMISRRKEEVIGKRLCELIPINRTEGFFEKYLRVVETQEVLEEEFPISSPEITASWLHHQVIPLADGIAVTSKDISDRKMAEEARKESEERFRNLVETTSDWIWQVDENAVYTYVSPQVRDILGYEIEEVLGKTPFDLMPPEEAQRVAEIFSHIVGLRQPFTNLENTNFHKNLHPVVLDTSGVPVFDKAGNFRGYRGIDRDITQRKIAQEALRTNEERFRSLSTCSPVGIFETDMAGRCLYTNPRSQEICGFTLEESLGEGWSRFVHPEDRDRVLAQWSLCARDGREYSDEFRFQTKERIVRWVHARSSPMFSAQGELIGHVGTVEDITSRRQAEVDMLATLDRERELSELRNSFLSLVSHEFRTPLTTIRSSAELLDRYNNRLSDEKKQTHYRRIESAVERMTQLLNEVLLIGQAEAGKLKFEPTPMDLVPWCRDLVEGMQVVVENAHANEIHQHALAQRSLYEIAFTSSGECVDAQMDEKLLGHILTNLLSNAIKYSPEGGTVQFDLVCTEREAIFRITDSGIGIPEEYLPQLFESFQRASNVGTIQGTGLGLAIVKKAVDLHRGTIAVESEVGVGTTFTVRLPLDTSP